MSVEGTLHLTNAQQQHHTLYFACALQPKWTVMTGGFSLRWHHQCHTNTTPVIARGIYFVQQNVVQIRSYCSQVIGNVLNIPLSLSFHPEKRQFCETSSEFVNKRLTSGGMIREDIIRPPPSQ